MAGISNNEIKRVKALQQKKFRDETGLFTVEGEKMVDEAVASPFKVENIYRREDIGEDAMKRISALSSPSPVLAVVRKPEDIYINDVSKLTSLLSKGGLYLALDTIRDPGNLGTILRIADWFGIDAVFATKDTVDVFNPKVVQATMGAIFRVKMHYVDLPALSDVVLTAGGKIFGTFLDGLNIYSRPLDNGDEAPVLIVIGNESEGISPAMAKLVTDRLYIPPYPADDPGSESLNAAVATALTVAEFRRRTM
ncbi:MAG: RNA methyltransferase [Bacteroidales bacterium]|jgi:TrmH family RNA methyltransferase|nr:RNA methyltransferase [Bacteroidales bacterium]MBO5979930.1 RNA methyltransferase [Bacteroidales bacterium]